MKDKKTEPSPPKMPPPSMRMDMPPGMAMTGHKIGDRVHAEFKGKVKRIEMGKDYDGKMRNMMEIEHEPDSVKITKAGKQKTVDEMADEGAEL